MTYDTNSRRDGVHRWMCDGVSCRHNVEAGLDKGFKEAFNEAKAEGWIANLEYPRGISTWRHYCPGCKKKLGD